MGVSGKDMGGSVQFYSCGIAFQPILVSMAIPSGLLIYKE